MKKKIWFQPIAILLFRLCGMVNSYRFEPNTITLTNFSDCPGNEKYSCRFEKNITHITRNKYTMNGELFFKEVIPPPIQVNSFFYMKKN